MFLNSLHCFLLNKPIFLSCAVFENSSDFLRAPWESGAELRETGDQDPCLSSSQAALALPSLSFHFLLSPAPISEFSVTSRLWTDLLVFSPYIFISHVTCKSHSPQCLLWEITTILQGPTGKPSSIWTLSPKHSWKSFSSQGIFCSVIVGTVFITAILSSLMLV